MPIYEYACQKCGHTVDALQKVSDPPLRKCPECGALKLKRLVSAPQFRLKGTGWYETDFKKDGRKRVVEKDDKPAAEPAAAASDGKDAKPAADAGKSAEPAPKADKPRKKAGKPAASSAAAD